AIDAFTGGIGFVVTTPRIWGYAIVPAVMLAVLSVAFIALGIWGAAELSAHLFDPVANTWMGIGKWIVTIMLGIIGILVAILLALLWAEPLSGVALERIAQAQERQLTGTAPPALPLLQSLWLSTRAMAFAVIPGGTALIILIAINLIYPPALVVTV